MKLFSSLALLSAMMLTGCATGRYCDDCCDYGCATAPCQGMDAGCPDCQYAPDMMMEATPVEGDVPMDAAPAPAPAAEGGGDAPDAVPAPPAVPSPAVSRSRRDRN